MDPRVSQFVKWILFILIFLAILLPPSIALGQIQANSENRKPANGDFILYQWTPSFVGIVSLFIFLYYYEASDLTAQQLFTPNLVFALVSLFFSINILILVLLRIRYATSPPSG